MKLSIFFLRILELKMKSVGTWENLFCIQDDCRVVEPLSLEMNQLILWNGGSCSFGKTAAPPSHHRRCWVCQKLNAWTSIAATSSLASRKRESFLCIDDFEFASNQTVDFVAGFCELSGFQGRSSNIGANLGTEMSGTNGTILWTSLDIFGNILGMIWDGMVRLEVELNVVSSTFEQLHMTLGDARQDPNMNKTWSWSTNDSQKPSRSCHICKTFRSHTTLWCRTIPDSLIFFVLTGLSRRRSFVILIVCLFTIVSWKPLRWFKKHVDWRICKAFLPS